jgi:hypothetical protein
MDVYRAFENTTQEVGKERTVRPISGLSSIVVDGNGASLKKSADSDL